MRGGHLPTVARLVREFQAQSPGLSVELAASGDVPPGNQAPRSPPWVPCPAALAVPVSLLCQALCSATIRGTPQPRSSDLLAFSYVHFLSELVSSCDRGLRTCSDFQPGPFTFLAPTESGIFCPQAPDVVLDLCSLY